MHRFGQKGPKDVAELEELRSWDHELHFTKIRLGHGRKTACCKQRGMILLNPGKSGRVAGEIGVVSEFPDVVGLLSDYLRSR